MLATQLWKPWMTHPLQLCMGGLGHSTGGLFLLVQGSAQQLQRDGASCLLLHKRLLDLRGSGVGVRVKG